MRVRVAERYAKRGAVCDDPSLLGVEFPLIAFYNASTHKTDKLLDYQSDVNCSINFRRRLSSNALADDPGTSGNGPHFLTVSSRIDRFGLINAGVLRQSE